MGMEPEQFFEDFVQGNYQDFVDNPWSIRHAFNAAVAASHMADHYFEFHQRHGSDTRSRAWSPAPFCKLEKLRKHANEKTDGAYNSIRSIAEAYKHLYVKRASSDVSSGGSVHYLTMPDEAEDIDEMTWGDGEMGLAGVAFTKRDGTSHEFGPVLKAVVECWRELLYS